MILFETLILYDKRHLCTILNKQLIKKVKPHKPFLLVKYLCYCKKYKRTFLITYCSLMWKPLSQTLSWRPSFLKIAKSLRLYILKKIITIWTTFWFFCINFCHFPVVAVIDFIQQLQKADKNLFSSLDTVKVVSVFMQINMSCN